MLRYLRVGFSFCCAVLCLLVITLWVRSHSWEDRLFVPLTSSRVLLLGSSADVVTIRAVNDLNIRRLLGSGSTVQTEPFLVIPGIQPAFSLTRLFHFQPYKDGVSMPHWFAALLLAAIATFAGYPWLRSLRQFSLRTLLLASTLVAIVLWLIIALLR